MEISGLVLLKILPRAIRIETMYQWEDKRAVNLVPEDIKTIYNILVDKKLITPDGKENTTELPRR